MHLTVRPSFSSCGNTSVKMCEYGKRPKKFDYVHQLGNFSLGGACGLGMRLGTYADSSDYLCCVNRFWMVLELCHLPSLPSPRIG